MPDDKGLPTPAEAKAILDALRKGSAGPMGTGTNVSPSATNVTAGIPKPMLMGARPQMLPGNIIPKSPSGPANFGISEVRQMLRDMGLKPGKVESSSGGTQYMRFTDPANPRLPDQSDFKIRFAPNTSNRHAGMPGRLDEDAPMRFFDTAGMHSGRLTPQDQVISGTPGYGGTAAKPTQDQAGKFYGKFIKNQEGDYYNRLPALENAIRYATGRGLVPSGTEPSTVNLPPQPVVRLPPDPNQMDFMHLLMENRGTQKPNNIVGGNPENLWHSSQMPQRLPNIFSPSDLLTTGKYPDMPQPANREPPLLPGNVPKNVLGPNLISPSQQGQSDKNFMDLLKALEQMKKPPGEPTPEQ